MSGRWLALAVALLAAGCAPGPTPPAANYAAPTRLAPLVLSFAPGDGELPVASAALLRRVAQALPVQTVPELYLSGPLTLRRAHSVRKALARPLVLYPAAPMPVGAAPSPDAGVLVLPVPDAILPEACRGVGERGPAGLWPGEDASRERLLPPGCATAASIEAQVDRPTDLLQGRLLPPGAASPFADAIEKYYRRNQPNQGSATPATPASTRGDSEGATAPGAPDANPLLGPLPTAAH